MTMKPDLDWMLADVVGVPYVRHAVVFSADGLLMARSEGTSKDDADRLAAGGSGFQSLGQGMGQAYGSGSKALSQVMVEFEGGFLFLRRAADGSHLAVVTEDKVDVKLIAQHMQAQVNKIGGRNLASPARADARA